MKHYYTWNHAVDLNIRTVVSCYLVPVVDLYLAGVIIINFFLEAWSSLFTQTLHTNIWRNNNFIRDKIVVVCVSVSKLFSYTTNKYWIGLRWFISFENF